MDQIFLFPNVCVMLAYFCYTIIIILEDNSFTKHTFRLVTSYADVQEIYKKGLINESIFWKCHQTLLSAIVSCPEIIQYSKMSLLWNLT